MNKIQDIVTFLVTRYHKSILVSVLILGCLSVFLLPQLRTDTNPYLLQKTHPSRVNLEILRNTYTSSRDSIVVLLEAKNTVFNPDTLSRIQKLTEAFETISLLSSGDIQDLEAFANGLNGESKQQLQSLIEHKDDEFAWEELDLILELIEESGQWNPAADTLFQTITTHLTPISKVTSLANTNNILGLDGTLDINPVYEDIPESKEGVATIQHRVQDNKLFHDVLVSKNNRYTNIILEIGVNGDQSEEQYFIYKRIQDILENEIPGDEKHYIAGLPAVSAALGHSIDLDSKRLFPVVLILVIICLYFSFRMFNGILVPVLVVLFSLSFTLALKVVFGIPINIITTAIPVFILSIGVADGIHIFSEYRDHLLAGLNKMDAVQQTVRELTPPVIMTSITTAAAFWSLSVTEIVQMRYFGLFISAGTLIAMLMSLLFIPSLLIVLPQSKIQRRKGASKLDHYFTLGLESLTRWAIYRARPILIIAVIIAIFSAYGASKVIVDNDAVGYHPSDSNLVVSTNTINDNMAGSMNLNLLIRAKDSDTEPLKEPENLKAIVELEDFLEKKPVVGKVLGITKLLKRINLVLHNGDPVYDNIPEMADTKNKTHAEENENISTENPAKKEITGKQMISQYLLLYENGGGDTVTDVIDYEYRQANTILILKTNSSREISILMDEIKAYTDAFFPNNLEIQFSGSANVLVAATEEIVSGQITSLLLSLALISVMLIYTFRSAKKGILAMIPLSATIIVNFGIMGFMKIPLDIGSAVVSSIVIGIGVDYAIHYISRLEENLKKGLGFEQALLQTVRHSGKAITFNAFVVGIGFIALMFSIMSPIVTMGWMITVTMFLSAFCTLVLLPASLAVLRAGFSTRKFIWLKPIRKPQVQRIPVYMNNLFSNLGVFFENIHGKRK